MRLVVVTISALALIACESKKAPAEEKSENDAPAGPTLKLVEAEGPDKARAKAHVVTLTKEELTYAAPGGQAQPLDGAAKEMVLPSLQQALPKKAEGPVRIRVEAGLAYGKLVEVVQTVALGGFSDIDLEVSKGVVALSMPKFAAGKPKPDAPWRADVTLSSYREGWLPLLMPRQGEAIRMAGLNDPQPPALIAKEGQCPSLPRKDGKLDVSFLKPLVGALCAFNKGSVEVTVSGDESDRVDEVLALLTAAKSAGGEGCVVQAALGIAAGSEGASAKLPCESAVTLDGVAGAVQAYAKALERAPGDKEAVLEALTKDSLTELDVSNQTSLPMNELLKAGSKAKSEAPVLIGQLETLVPDDDETRQIVKKIMRRHQGGVRHCFRSVEAKDHPRKFSVAFAYDAAGRVAGDVEVEGVSAEPLRTCLQKVARRVRFPAPKSERVEVTFGYLAKPRQ